MNIQAKFPRLPAADIYQIIDTQTGQQHGADYTNKARARARVDYLDNNYGGYRYSLRTVYGDAS